MFRAEAVALAGVKGRHDRSRTHHHWGATARQLTFGEPGADVALVDYRAIDTRSQALAGDTGADPGPLAGGELALEVLGTRHRLALGLVGRHVALDACAALAAAIAAGAPVDLALRGLATGGVVVGGGIPPKILPALRQPRFLERFTAKGRFAGWARSLGVRVTLEPRAALLGAAHHAATHKDGV